MSDGGARLSLHILPGKYVVLGSVLDGNTNWAATFHFRANQGVNMYSFDVVVRPTAKYEASAVDYGYAFNVLPHALRARKILSAMFGGYAAKVHTNLIVNEWFSWEQPAKPELVPLADKASNPLLTFHFFREQHALLLFQTDKAADLDAGPKSTDLSWRTLLTEVPYADDAETIARPVSTVQIGNKSCLVYYVEDGDTAATICKAFLIPIEQLLRFNPRLKNGAALRAGESLLIPVPDK